MTEPPRWRVIGEPAGDPEGRQVNLLLRPGGSPAPGDPGNRALPRRISASFVLIGLATVISIVVIGLLAVVIWISLHTNGSPSSSLTTANYIDLYGEPSVRSVLLNTLQFSVTATAVGGVLGGTLAWVVERTDFGRRRLVYVSTTLALLIPGYAVAMGWVFLMDQNVGALNVIAMRGLGLDGPPFSIVSYVGMGWVQGLGLAPIFFIMTSSSFRAMDAALEDAAHISGANAWDTLRVITLPLLYPGILAAVIFAFTIAIGAFDIPLIIGSANLKFTFGTYLYFQIHSLDGLPKYGVAAAFAAMMVVLALLLSVVYTRVLAKAKKYEIVTGRGYHPRLIKLGRLRVLAVAFVVGYLGLAVVGPLLMVAWMSLQPYLRAPSLDALGDLTFDNYRSVPWEVLERGLRNTIVLMFSAPTLTVLASLVFSWVVLRSTFRLRFIYDLVAFLPHAVPSVAFALAALLVATYWTLGPIDLYGTLLLLIIVLGLGHLSFGTRMVNSSLVQINRGLEEAAEVSGATTFGVFHRVTFQLIKPVLVYTWIWLALLVFRELTVVAMLSSGGTVTLSTAISSMWVGAEVGEAAAATLVVFAAMVALILGYFVASRRLGRSARDAHFRREQL